MKFIDSYKFRFLFSTIIFMLVTCFLLSFFAISDMERASTETFSKQGDKVAQTVLEMMDVEKFERLSISQNSTDPYYYELHDKFNELLNLYKCEYLYTMVQKEDTVFTYIIDGTDMDSEDFSPLGTEEDIESYGSFPFDCLEKQIVTYSDIEYQDEWGWMITIYAPIINKEGKSIGFVGVDYTVDGLQSIIQHSRIKMIFTGLILAFLCIVINIFVILGFFKDMNRVKKAMENLSGGSKDLTVRLSVSGNELGLLSKACNDVVDSMQHMMKIVSGGVNEVTENSVKISEQNKQMVNLIQEANEGVNVVQTKAGNQTELIYSLDKKIENFNESINLLNEKIKEQVNAVNESIDAVTEIVNQINTVDISIQNISNEYKGIVKDTKENTKKQNEMTEKIDYIAEQMQKLLSVNSIITSIANKTNLLAMNASIEASHAGEAGKGFSVVASEIRALAANSTQQTENISKLIFGIEEAVNEIVNSSKTSASAFSQLGAKIESLYDMMERIKNNMSVQIHNAENIDKMMKILNSSAEVISNASDSLNEDKSILINGISSIEDSASEILGSSNETGDLLKKMSDFALGTKESSDMNEKSAERINDMLLSYKIL